VVVAVLAVLFGLSVGALVAVQVLFETYRTPSHSMVPTIQPGDRLVAWSHVGGGARRGDIVIFEPPPAAVGGVGIPSLMGRVVGVGGDRVAFANGKLMVNGRVTDEPYLAAGTVTNGYRRASIDVPLGSIYVLGDNRENAQDSRVYGPVPDDTVKGRVEFTNVPLEWITLGAVVASGAALGLALLYSASRRRERRPGSPAPTPF